MKKNNKIKKYKIAGLMVAVLAVGLLATTSVKANEGSLTETIDTLSLKIQNLIESVKILKSELATVPEMNIGSSTNIQQGVPSILGTDSGYGVRATDASGNPKDLVQGLFWTSMPATGVNTSTAFMTNSTGRSILLNTALFHVQFAGTVSSSVDVSCATSTANGIASFTTALASPFLQAYRLPTSTASVSALEVGLANPTTTRKLVVVANGNSIICKWNQSFENGCTGSTCESTSSTNRGYTANVFAPWVYAADPQI